jgi:hypothetical protein
MKSKSIIEKKPTPLPREEFDELFKKKKGIAFIKKKMPIQPLNISIKVFISWIYTCSAGRIHVAWQQCVVLMLG